MSMNHINEFSRYVRDLAASLHATKILYVGCCNTDDLSEFPINSDVCGVTEYTEVLEKIIEQFPNFEFRQSSLPSTPYTDGKFDFVFTHKLFDYLDEADAEKMTEELYRISSKYIVNFELFSQDANTHKMYNRWLNFQVKIISNVQMHEDIDSEQCQFTLVRKIN